MPVRCLHVVAVSGVLQWSIEPCTHLECLLLLAMLQRKVELGHMQLPKLVQEHIITTLCISIAVCNDVYLPFFQHLFRCWSSSRTLGLWCNARVSLPRTPSILPSMGPSFAQQKHSVVVVKAADENSKGIWLNTFSCDITAGQHTSAPSCSEEKKQRTSICTTLKIQKRSEFGGPAAQRPPQSVAPFVTQTKGCSIKQKHRQTKTHAHNSKNTY